MPRFFARAIAVVVALCVQGCSTLHNIPDWRANASGDPAAPDRGLRAGDVVRVSTRSSEAVELVVTELGPDTLIGWPVGSEETARIPVSEIVKVERREPTALSRAGLRVLSVTGWVIVFSLTEFLLMH